MTAPHPLSEILGQPDPRALTHALLQWYRREHRDLPWRAPPGQLPNPYHVLVSEAMLQQTQVATVVGYFHRFMDAFPTVEALAAADEQHVLRLWQGLGYYRRARHLHRAARQIVQQHHGRVPDRLDQLLQLPGVGRYTAGAIASIAHGQPEPVVDGNVIRVLGRLLALNRPADEPETRDRLWATAAALHPSPEESGKDDAEDGFTPGDLNQALMELGARICTARAPSCLLCPLQSWCAAAPTGEPERYPPPRTRATQRPVTHRILSIRRGRQHLFVQRPDTGLWAGLWQLPTLEGAPEPAPAVKKPATKKRTTRNNTGSANAPKGNPANEAPAPNADASSAATLADWVRRRFNLTISPPTLRGTFEHHTTHRRIRFEVWEAPVQAGRLRPNAGLWRRLDRVEDLPLANPQRRALQLIAGQNH